MSGTRVLKDHYLILYIKGVPIGENHNRNDRPRASEHFGRLFQNANIISHTVG